MTTSLVALGSALGCTLGFFIGVLIIEKRWHRLAKSWITLEKMYKENHNLHVEVNEKLILRNSELEKQLDDLRDKYEGSRRAARKPRK